MPEFFIYNEVKCTSINLDSIIPFEDNYFDAVYAIEVLEHTSRPYDFIVEAYRVLKPGGILIISVPNMSHILSRFSSFFLQDSHRCSHPHRKNKKTPVVFVVTSCLLVFHTFIMVWARAGFEDINLISDRLKEAVYFGMLYSFR